MKPGTEKSGSTSIRDRGRRMSRAQRLVDIGCIVCLLEYGLRSEPEIHHLRKGMGMGQRNDEEHTIPLCPAHHRHGPMGVAFHSGPRSWQEIHGTESLLLAVTNDMLDAS